MPGADIQNFFIVRRKELADFSLSDRNLQFPAFPQRAKSLFPADGKRSWITRKQFPPELAAEREEKGLKS